MLAHESHGTTRTSGATSGTRLAVACRRSWEVEVADGVVSLAAEGADAADRHVAEVVAAALPGVREVRLVETDSVEPT